ncbi:MAG: hypothetical protein WD604_02390 [Balneolaceae bacterium]
MRKLSFILLFPLIALVKTGCEATNTTPVYTLTTSISPAESGTITPADGEYDKETVLEVNAEPEEGYLFVRWEGDHSGSINPAFITFNSDKNITAVFVRKEYELTIDVTGEGNVREEIVEEASKTDYEHGTHVQLTAEPDEGWRFVEWEGDLTGSNNPETLIIEDEKNVTAVFEIIELSMNIQIEGEGSVTADPDKSSYQYGEDILLTAEPNEGWRFLEWSGDLSGTEQSVTIEGIDEDKEITAAFTVIEGALFGTGLNHVGQLGDGTTTSYSEPSRNIYEVERISAGAYHSLFVKKDGSLWAMGFNSNGQLGNNSTSDQHDPVEIDNGVETVSARERHSLYLKTDGTLWAMGRNESGQLGNGSTTDLTVPEQVPAEGDVIAISAGYNHNLYLTSDNRLWGMGSNSDGQLGDGTTTDQPSPILIAENVIAIAAGDRYSLFIDNNNDLYGMGRSSGGKLGIGGSDSSPPENQLEPIHITGDVESVSAGRHSLLIKTDGSLWTMGYNDEGQLGIGTTDNQFEPVEVTTDGAVTAVAAGNRHSLFTTSGGGLYAMGRNNEGQLGDGTTDNKNSPVQIENSRVSEITVGFEHSLYIKD